MENTVDGVVYSPFFKIGVIPDSIPEYSLIIFHSHNFFAFRGIIFQLQNKLFGFGSQ